VPYLGIKCRTAVAGNPALYLGGSAFESWPQDWLCFSSVPPGE